MQKKKGQKKQIGISLHRKYAKPINMKNCSILSVIKEMHIITTMIDPLTITRLVEFKINVVTITLIHCC